MKLPPWCKTLEDNPNTSSRSSTKEAKMLEEMILNSEACFKEILDYVQEEGNEQPIDEVEKGVFNQLLELGQHLMRVFVAKQDSGYVGKTVTVTQDGDQEAVELDYYDNRVIDYLSIFGPVKIPRSYYYRSGHGGICPLDEQLNLPERKYSYLLQRWLSAHCVKDTYDEAVKELEELLGVSIPKRSMQLVMRDVSQKVDDFWDQQSCPGGDAQIIVISADGKGVPMKQSSDKKASKRLKKGQKRTKKKEAVVGTIYTVSRERQSSGTRQVRAVNKEVYASLLGKEHVYNHLKKRAVLRGLGEKNLLDEALFMADGDPALWTQKEVYFPGMTEALDFYHVSEYLWEIAHMFLAEGSKEAGEWVERKEAQLKAGRVGYMIGGLRQMLTKGKRIRGQEKRDGLKRIIGYFERNRHRMQYDEYLALGYPIGTGAVEGTCKNLVKERMEGTGMRWTVAGAEAVLKLRSVYQSHYWREFWNYYTISQTSTNRVA